MVGKLIRHAYNGDHTKVRKVAKKLTKTTGLRLEEAVVSASARHGLLHMAAVGGHRKVCRILINEFRLNVNGTDVDGATPLLFAIYGKGELEAVVRLLLDSNADPNRANAKGQTPIHPATHRGCITKHVSDVVKMLLSKKAVVDAVCKYETPLYIAARRGHETIVKLLLQNKAMSDGYLAHTPLKAAVLGHAKIAMEVEAGAHVNAGMPESPLIAAAASSFTKIVKCLLEAGADANITDADGRTSLEIPAINGWWECVAILFPVRNHLARVACWNSLPQDLLQSVISDFMAKGDAAFSRSDYAHALTLYTMAMEIDPGDSTLYARRILCFLHTNDEARASEDAKTYQSMQPDLPESLLEKSALVLVKFG